MLQITCFLNSDNEVKLSEILTYLKALQVDYQVGVGSTELVTAVRRIATTMRGVAQSYQELESLVMSTLEELEKSAPTPTPAASVPVNKETCEASQELATEVTELADINLDDDDEDDAASAIVFDDEPVNRSSKRAAPENVMSLGRKVLLYVDSHPYEIFLSALGVSVAFGQGTDWADRVRITIRNNCVLGREGYVYTQSAPGKGGRGLALVNLRGLLDLIRFYSDKRVLVLSPLEVITNLREFINAKAPGLRYDKEKLETLMATLYAWGVHVGKAQRLPAPTPDTIPLEERPSELSWSSSTPFELIERVNWLGERGHTVKVNYVKDWKQAIVTVDGHSFTVILRAKKIPQGAAKHVNRLLRSA